MDVVYMCIYFNKGVLCHIYINTYSIYTFYDNDVYLLFCFTSSILDEDKYMMLIIERGV